MFKNLTKLVNVIGEVADVAVINVNSLKNISEAGEYKSEMFREASKFDTDKQRVDLTSQLELFKLERIAAPKS
ncbi:MAG: hypothetical protein HOK84_08430 [Bacteroidetes bacterium]|nr:hypothetical protein [Bacteroidota bacterium]